MAGKFNMLSLFCILSLLAPETYACLSSPKPPEDSKPPHTWPGGSLDPNRTNKPTTSITQKYPTTETSNATTSVPKTSHPNTVIPTTSIPTTLVTTLPNQPASTESTETTNRISTELPSIESAVVTSTEPNTVTTIGPSLWQVLPSSSNGRVTSNAGSPSYGVLIVVGIFLLT